MAFITARIVSAKYAIPLPTVYYYANNNTLPSYQIGGRRKFREEEVEKVVKQGKSANARIW